MYHEITTAMRSRRRRNRIIVAIIIIAIVVAAVLAYFGVTLGMREQAAASIRTSILDAAKQCAAIEGSYPPSLTYLEDNYGLRVSQNDYVITYDVFASNIMPTVLVLPR